MGGLSVFGGKEESRRAMLFGEEKVTTNDRNATCGFWCRWCEWPRLLLLWVSFFLLALRELCSETGVASDLFGRMKGATSLVQLGAVHLLGTLGIYQNQSMIMSVHLATRALPTRYKSKPGTVPLSSSLLTHPPIPIQNAYRKTYLALLTAKSAKCPERIKYYTGTSSITMALRTIAESRYRWRGLRDN